MRARFKEAGKETGLLTAGVVLISTGVVLVQQGNYEVGILLIILGIVVILLKEWYQIPERG